MPRKSFYYDQNTIESFLAFRASVPHLGPYKVASLFNQQRGTSVSGQIARHWINRDARARNLSGDPLAMIGACYGLMRFVRQLHEGAA